MYKRQGCHCGWTRKSWSRRAEPPAATVVEQEREQGWCADVYKRQVNSNSFNYLLWIPVQSWKFPPPGCLSFSKVSMTLVFSCKINFNNSYWLPLTMCHKYGSFLCLSFVVNCHPTLAPLETFSLDFHAVHGMRSILLWSHISKVFIQLMATTFSVQNIHTTTLTQCSTLSQLQI